MSDVDRELELIQYQGREHEAWLTVVKELRDAGAGAINAGEPNERLHDAIVRWGEELVQLRMADPQIEHAVNALRDRREAAERWA